MFLAVTNKDNTHIQLHSLQTDNFHTGILSVAGLRSDIGDFLLDVPNFKSSRLILARMLKHLLLCNQFHRCR